MTYNSHRSLHLQNLSASPEVLLVYSGSILENRDFGEGTPAGGCLRLENLSSSQAALPTPPRSKISLSSLPESDFEA